MKEFEARADHPGNDARESYSVGAISRYTSKADYVRATDLGLTVESRLVRMQAERLQTVVRIVALLSGIGFIGAFIAALDFFLDTVEVPGLTVLIEQRLGCDDQGACIVVLGLPLPVLLGLIVSGLANLLAIAGYLRLRTATVKTLGTVSYSMAQRAESILTNRFVHLGSGQMTFSLGSAGLRVSVAGRSCTFQWSTFDGTELLHRGGDDPIWPDAAPEALDGADLDTLFALKKQSSVVEGLVAAARTWSAKHDFIDLPLRVDRSVDTDGRPCAAGGCAKWTESLRVPKRYFHGAGNSFLAWPNFVAACVFMIVQCDPNLGIIGDDAQ